MKEKKTCNLSIMNDFQLLRNHKRNNQLLLITIQRRTFRNVISVWMKLPFFARGTKNEIAIKKKRFGISSCDRGGKVVDENDQEEEKRKGLTIGYQIP